MPQAAPIKAINTLEDIESLYQYLIAGNRLNRAEADALSLCINRAEKDAPELFNRFFELANALRQHFIGSEVELCSIINVKNGKCSEDCKFCAQSAHYPTAIDPYEFMDYEPVKAMAQENAAAGVHRFSLVASGYGASDDELALSIKHYKQLKQDVDIKLCASLGVLNTEQMSQLKAAGVTLYHHNVETSRRYYGEICSTHTYEDRIQTILAAQAAGLTVCSGGILGLGETPADRLDMIFELRELGINSIPVNVLNPIPGTPLAGSAGIGQSDVYKTVALFRWIHPSADIRLAGGRALLEQAGRHCFEIGASATITGNYLTTSGQTIAEDLEMLSSLGLKAGLGCRKH